MKIQINPLIATVEGCGRWAREFFRVCLLRGDAFVRDASAHHCSIERGCECSSGNLNQGRIIRCGESNCCGASKTSLGAISRKSTVFSSGHVCALIMTSSFRFCESRNQYGHAGVPIRGMYGSVQRSLLTRGTALQSALRHQLRHSVLRCAHRGGRAGERNHGAKRWRFSCAAVIFYSRRVHTSSPVMKLVIAASNFSGVVFDDVTIFTCGFIKRNTVVHAMMVKLKTLRHRCKRLEFN